MAEMPLSFAPRVTLAPGMTGGALGTIWVVLGHHIYSQCPPTTFFFAISVVGRPRGGWVLGRNRRFRGRFGRIRPRGHPDRLAQGGIWYTRGGPNFKKMGLIIVIDNSRAGHQNLEVVFRA